VEISDTEPSASLKFSLTASCTYSCRLGWTTVRNPSFCMVRAVGSGTKVGDDVDPILFGGGDDRDIRLEVGDGALGTGDHGVGGIRHPAGNPGALCLSRSNNRGKQKDPHESRALCQDLPCVVARRGLPRIKAGGRIVLRLDQIQLDKLTGHRAMCTLYRAKLDYSPPTVSPSTRSVGAATEPRNSRSFAISEMLKNNSFKLPATVISSTG
jgi:hypothetical protein